MSAIGSISRQLVEQTLTAAGNINLDTDHAFCDATAGAFTAALPISPGDGAFYQIIVEKTDSSANAVLVSDGTFSFSLPSQYDAVICQLSQSGVWFGVSGFDRSGTGDFEGPASSTDNAIVRFDGTTGKVGQNSTVTIADTTGAIAGTQSITLSGATSGSVAVAATTTGGGLTAGTGPTTLTDSAGKILSAALNTVAVAQGGTGVTASTGTVAVVLSNSPALVTPSLGVASATSLTVAAAGKLGILPKTNDTYSSSMTIDVTISNHIIAVANGTSATCTMTPSAAGTAGDLLFITQNADASGTVTTTFASTFHSLGTQATTLSTHSTIAFMSNGTIWCELFRTTALA